MNAEIRYNALLNTARQIVDETARASGLNISEVAENAGCAPDSVKAFFDGGAKYLSGKDWERLISFCVLPETWVFRANVESPENVLVETGIGGGGLPPSPEMEGKIRRVFSTASWFYQESTQRYINNSL